MARRFRLFGLHPIVALALGALVFVCWKPLSGLFKGLVEKFKPPVKANEGGTAPQEK